MAWRIDLAPRVPRDVDGILAHLAGASPAAARDWYEGLLRAIRSLEEMPHRCGAAPEDDVLRAEIRQLLYRDHRILFWLGEEARTVHVLHVRHGARRFAEPGDLR